MPADLPYLPSYKNVGVLFEKIAAAKLPDAFTHQFLYETIGLKSAGDRPLISLLKTLGFIDGSSKPTAEYSRLKNPAEAKKALGDAIRRAYAPLFSANEKAQELQPDALKGLVAQVAGTDSNITQKITGTLNSLLKNADLSLIQPQDADDHNEPAQNGGAGIEQPVKTTLQPQFHYNIQIHLPSNGSEDTYLNIFNALRKIFQ